jgi:hypothetical protein
MALSNPSCGFDSLVEKARVCERIAELPPVMANHGFDFWNGASKWSFLEELHGKCRFGLSQRARSCPHKKARNKYECCAEADEWLS